MEERIKEILKEALEIEDHDVKLEDEFRNYHEWDSLNRLSLIALIDENFNIQIENEKFNQLKTVRDLLSHIEEHRG